MNSPHLPKYLLPCVLVTALLALFSISGRYKIEARNKSVSISAEYETIESLAAAQGITIDRALSSMRQQGLRSVVLSEETAGELISEGRLAVRYSGKSGTGAVVATNIAPFVSGSPEDLIRVVKGNSIRYGSFSTPVDQTDGSKQFPNLTPGMLRALPLGIDPDASQKVKAANLTIVARMGNPVGISSKGVEDTVAWAHLNGAKIFCPQGDQVLGRRESIKALIKALTDNQMLYASPEFAKIGGDQEVLELAPQLITRLHSAQAAELDKLPLAEAVDRYSRAARERNMRILLIRPVNYAGEKPLNSFGDFSKKIAQAIEKQGSVLGDPHQFSAPSTPKIVFLLIGLSLAPIVWFIVGAFYKPAALPLTVLSILMGIACYSPHYRQYSALLGSLVFPIAAFLVLDASKGKNVFLEYLITTCVSLVGGLTVAGLLNALPYYIRAQEFPGVKLAVFFPIALCGFYFFRRFFDAKATMKSSITWGTALFGLLLLAALGLMLARTGNDNPAAVSSVELKLRDLLDVLLFVRPRTKAFMIGFPLLLVGIALLKRRENNLDFKNLDGYLVLALVGGFIGQTDIVNTLCHIHTPIALSLERIGIAFISGSLIGWVLWQVVKYLLARSSNQLDEQAYPSVVESEGA